jgi:16S rRNA (guanine527-N7)-methyltransferase
MPLKPLSPREFQVMSGVSDEALAKLAQYVALLTEWQNRVNLIAPSTFADIWRRHVLDSAQLVDLIPAGTRKILDLGSGGGFPGMVLAILGAAPEIHLVDSDGRKARFLETVSRETFVPTFIHNCRSESLEKQRADVVTARAVAPLKSLLDHVFRHKRKGGIALVMKGARVDEELTQATPAWDIQFDRIQSRSDASGVILKIGEIRRHHDRRDR